MAKPSIQDDPPDHVLSFFTDSHGDQLFVHADRDGLDLLIRYLTRLRSDLDQGECEDLHLFTTPWSGSGDLSTRGVGEGERLIHMVTVYAWTPEWVEKHDLKDPKPNAP
jgi:hypothetical protein